MREPARPGGRRGLRRQGPRLLVQGFSPASEAAKDAAEAKAANDDGLIAPRLQVGAGRARRQAIAGPICEACAPCRQCCKLVGAIFLMDRKPQEMAGTALPPVAFPTQPKPVL